MEIYIYNKNLFCYYLNIIHNFLLFQNYPYKGTEYEILKQIESNKQLNVINDKLLDDLLKKMLNPNKNKDIQILNCYEEAKKQYPKWNWDEIKCVENEKEIKNKSELYLNNQKIQFCFKYKFEKEGKNTINIIFNNLLNNTNFMFYIIVLL